MEASTSPIDLIIPPAEAARVERLSSGDFVLRWSEPARLVAVAISGDPDATTNRHSIPVTGAPGGELLIDRETVSAALGSRRPYFLLELDGRRHVVAERVLALGNGVNFRDLGGYITTGGRAVRWGRVYRAGSLADLSDEDIAYLQQVGLRLSCDLRSPDEVTEHPDRLPPGAVARHMPIAAEVGRVRRAVTLFRKRHRIQELLLDVYKVMLDQNGPIFAEVIRAAAGPANLPLVIHCTAGKDRTGLAAALLLLALGVPVETVIADYTLSNLAFDVLAGRMRPEMERLYAFGFGEVQVRPFLLAEARTLAGALAHLRHRYGSVEWYLLRAGLGEEEIERLRATLLTAAS